MSITRDFFLTKLVSKSELGSLVLNFLIDHKDSAYAPKEIFEALNLDVKIYCANDIYRILTMLQKKNKILYKHGFYIYNLENSIFPVSEENLTLMDIDALDYSMFKTKNSQEEFKKALLKLMQSKAKLTLDNLRRNNSTVTKNLFLTFMIRNDMLENNKTDIDGVTE